MDSATFVRSSKDFFSFLLSVFNRFYSLGGSSLAAAISYYLLLSLFPILILTISILGYVTQDYGIFYSAIIDSVGNVMPGYVDLVERNLDTIIKNSGSLSFLALAGLLWVSIGIFSSIEFSLNTIFDVQQYKTFLRTRLLGLSFVFLLACFILASTLITPLKGLVIFLLSYLPLVDQQKATFLLGFVLTLLPLVFSYFLFYIIYRFIPAKKLGEREVMIGAAVAAFLWELAKNLLVWYLTARMPYYQLVYGSLVLIILSILWSYFFSIILVYTACIIYTLNNRRIEREKIDLAL
ncbi:YihY/virulence factor BrkB family protein [Candidatus Altiarchaeota archaeon]